RSDDEGQRRAPTGALLLDELVVGRPAAETLWQDVLEQFDELRADEVHPLRAQLLVAADRAERARQAGLVEGAAARGLAPHAVVAELEVDRDLRRQRRERRQVERRDRLAGGERPLPLDRGDAVLGQ